MSLGREDRSVARTRGRHETSGLAGFLCDDDLISHDSWFRENRRTIRTYREQNGLASCTHGAASGRISGTRRGCAIPVGA